MIYFCFLLAMTAWIVQGAILPTLGMLAFAPFIALSLLRSTKIKALYWCAFAGALVDLLSDDPMGLHALNYVLCAACFWRIRKHFLFDQPLHVSVLTALISCFSTALQLLLLFLFDRRVPFDGRWILADLIGMPVVDALYAFVWFSAPLALFEKLRRIWTLFWLKRKNPSPTSH